MAPQFDQVNVGDKLPPLTLAPISRKTLALYAGASGDHMAVHIDQDVARAARYPDVFAHGMLTVAYLGRLLTNWVAQERIREMSVRFVAITHLYNAPMCTAEVIEKLEHAGEKRVRVAVKAENQYGEVKIVGEAVLAIA
ncbi:dehydratase [Burkholderiaceae bacterium 16]|nr:dehydratase [Burkholderiaceae bacterium 16]